MRHQQTDQQRHRQTDQQAERIRRGALSAGDLVDVSTEAASIGIRLPVAVSQRLWCGLIKPFPSARSRECLPLAELLTTVKILLSHQGILKHHVRYVCPPARPDWVSRRFLVRVEFNHDCGRVVAIIICCADEAFGTRGCRSAAVMPASLLLRLGCVLNNLSLVFRTADDALLRRMLQTTVRLLVDHPLKAEITRQIAHQHRVLPATFSKEEYRRVLLATLGQLLICLSACPSASNAGECEELAKLYGAMVSPLSDMATLTESLLRIAARLPEGAGPIRPAPFGALLRATAQMQTALDRTSTTVASDVLVTIRAQFSAVAQAVTERDWQDIRPLWEAFQRLDDGSPPGGLVDLADPPGHTITWQ